MYYKEETTFIFVLRGYLLLQHNLAHCGWCVCGDIVLDASVGTLCWLFYLQCPQQNQTYNRLHTYLEEMKEHNLTHGSF